MKTLLTTVFGCLALSLVLEAREWTNAAGKVIEADFVGLEGENVILSMNGKEYRVLLTNFSESDQEFAREQSEQGGAAEVTETEVEFPLALTKWVSGEKLEGTEHSGKPIVIHPWEAYCARCPASLEDFEKFAKRKRNLDAVFMIWHNNSKFKMAQDKSEALELTLPVYHGRSIKWDDKFGEFVWPHVIIMQPDGEIVYQGAADRDFEKALKEVSQEP